LTLNGVGPILQRMAAEKPDTAVLEVDSVDGRLTDDLKARFYDVVFASLDKTGKFHLLPKADTPHLPQSAPGDEVGVWQEALGGSGVSHAFVIRCEEAVNRLTGQPCWKFTFLLYDLKDGRRLALKEHFLGKESPADDLKWALYEFADPDRFAELAKEHRLTQLSKDPATLGGDPQFLTTMLLASLQKADWETALDMADRLLVFDPRNALALHSKGLALFRRGRLQ